MVTEASTGASSVEDFEVDASDFGQADTDDRVPRKGFRSGRTDAAGSLSWSGQWLRVSSSRRCPVCGRPDWCTVTSDGGAAICMRTPSEREIDCKGAGVGWLHRLTIDDDPAGYVHPGHRQELPRRDGVSKPTRPKRRSAPPRPGHRSAGVRRLAEELGVSVDSLASIGVQDQTLIGRFGYVEFPEKNGEGRVIGLNRRDLLSGRKKQKRGTRRGLTYAENWDRGGPVVIVEGGSDTAAGLDLGLTVIGRPSNRGGVEFLAEMLQDIPPERRIIVLGERDQKKNGFWPGRDGAIRTADDLKERLGRGRPVEWALPPDGVKDLRAWKNLQDNPTADALFDEIDEALSRETDRLVDQMLQDEESGRVNRFTGHAESCACPKCKTGRPQHPDDASKAALRQERVYTAVPTLPEVKLPPEAEKALDEIQSGRLNHRTGHARSCSCPECSFDEAEFRKRQDEEKAKHATSCGFRVQMERRDDPDHKFFGSLFCSCWSCDHCREHILKPKWKGTAKEAVELSRKHLFRAVIRKSQWGRVRKRIERLGKKLRRGGNHLRIEPSPGTLVVWSDVEFEGSKAEKPDQFYADIDSLDGNVLIRRPIHASQAWRPPKPEKKFRRVREEERIAVWTFNSLKQAAEEFRLEIFEWGDEGSIRKAMEIQFPDAPEVWERFKARVEALSQMECPASPYGEEIPSGQSGQDDIFADGFDGVPPPLAPTKSIF